MWLVALLSTVAVQYQEWQGSGDDGKGRLVFVGDRDERVPGEVEYKS